MITAMFWLGWTALAASGWRQDGTGVATGASPPPTWPAPLWSAPMPAWGNASAVSLGDLICAVAEPVTVICVDAATGRQAWTASNEWLETVTGEERTRWEGILAQAPALDDKIRDAQRRMSELRKAARGGDAQASSQLPVVSAELDSARQQLDAINVFRTPANKDVIGYASPTPWSDGTDLWVMTGNGVLSRFTAGGRRVWSIWLGPPVEPMKGYQFGSVSSPFITDGVLVAAHRAMHGVDPATGAVRWRDAAVWNHYGTPTSVDLGGWHVLALPDGRLLRARDGAALGDVGTSRLYTGPVAEGRRLFYAGTADEGWSPSSFRAEAFDLSPAGGGLSVSKVWSVNLPVAERVYASALAWQGQLYVLNRHHQLMVLSGADGSVTCSAAISDHTHGVAFQNPIAVAGGIIFGSDRGLYTTVRAGTCDVVTQNQLPESSHATPLFVGAHVYVRGDKRLYAW